MVSLLRSHCCAFDILLLYLFFFGHSFTVQLGVFVLEINPYFNHNNSPTAVQRLCFKRTQFFPLYTTSQGWIFWW